MATPGQILDIGTADGQNHFNVGIGRPGAHTDYSPTQIQGASGYSSDPEFISNAAGTAVQFRVRMDAARTSANTSYPRSELREYNEAGTDNASWNGASGTHYMSGISKVTHLQPVKPWVVFCQIHDASSDLIRVQTEGTSTSALKLVARNTPPGSSSETVKTVQTSYTIGNEIIWKLEVINGSGILYINNVNVQTFGGSTSGCYFKAGSYAQSNSSTDSASEYAAVELRSLQTWHTGYPTPNPPPGGGGGGGGGGGTVVTPATVLDIGSTAGQNHFKYAGGRTGNAAFFERSQQQIQDGFTEDPYFALNTAQAAVKMTVNADAPTQSGTTFPRAEVREMGTNGTTVYAFNAADSGTHYIRGRTRITSLGTSSPTGKNLRIVELNNGTDPMVTIETQYVTSNVRLRCLINGAPQTPDLIDVAGDTNGTASVVGVEFAWMVKVVAGVVSVYYNDMTTAAATGAMTSTGSSSWFFRTGALPQFNETTDAAGVASVELRALEHWHTGWPASLGNGSTASASPPIYGAAGTYVENAVGGPITPPFPAGVSPGHTCLTQIYVRTGSAPTTPSGWTLLASLADTGGGRHAAYYRVYASGDTAPSYSAGSDGIYGRMTRYIDVDQVTPFDATPVTSAASSTTTVTAPSITVLDSSLIVQLFAHRNDYVHATPTNSTTLAYTNTTATGGDAVISAVYKTLNVPGPSGATSLTASGQTTLPDYSAISVALSPVEPHVLVPMPAVESVVEPLEVLLYRTVEIPIVDLVVQATGDKTTVDALDSIAEPLQVQMFSIPRVTPTVREVLQAVKLYSDADDTVSVTTGTTTQANDLLVAIYGLDYGDANQSASPGLGWAQAALSSASSVSPHIKVWVKRLTVGGAQVVSLTHTDQWADALLVVLVLSGTNEQQPLSVWAAGAGAHATSHVAPAIDPVDTDELLVCAWMSGPNAGDMGNYAAATGMTERAEVDATNYSTLAVDVQALNSADSTGTRTATFTRSTAPSTVTSYASISLGFRGATPTSSSTQVSALGLESTIEVHKTVTVVVNSPLAVSSAGSTFRKAAIFNPTSPLGLTSGVAVERDVRSLPAGGPIDLSLWALDAAGEYLGPLPDAISIALSPVINQPGGVSIQYPADGVNFGLLHDMIGDDRDLEVSIWVGGREDGSLRAMLNESSGDEVDEHGIWTFTGFFLEGRMAEAVVYPNSADEKGETHFSNATAGSVVRTLMVQAQARGTLTDMFYDSFNNSIGSNGATFTKTVTMTVSPGQDYLKVMGDLVDLGLCEWEIVTEGTRRTLKVYEPETRGIDRSQEWPPIVLRAGKDLTDSPRKHSIRDSPTVLLAAGKDGIYQAVSDSSAQTRRGRRIESFVSQGSIDDAGALLAYTQAVLAGQVVGTMELSQGLTFAPGGPLPLADFDRFDWVLSDNGNGLELLRVAQWTITQDANGQLTGSAVLNDFVADAQAKLAKRLAALEGGTAVVGTSDPTPPEDDVLAPAAPTGVVVSSLPYQNSEGATEASVTAGWTRVQTNADGTALDDLEGYLIRYRYLGLNQTNTQEPIYGTGAGSWQPVSEVNASSLRHSFSGVTAGVDIEVAVAAKDRAGNVSAYSTPFSLTTANDLLPPNQASIPAVTEYLGTIRISWDGLDYQGDAMAPDFQHVEVHYSVVQNFEPDGTTFHDKLFGAGVTVATGLDYQVSYYAKLVPIDLSGNRGIPSVEGVAVPQPVVGDDIFEGAIGSAKLADLAVIRAKIADLAVNNAKIGDMSVGKLTAGIMTADILLAGRIKTADTGARIELDGTSFRQYNSTGQLRTQFVAATGDALVTGTIRSAMTGKRWEMQPDGSLRLYPTTGQNYSQISNYGNDVVWRGPLDATRFGNRLNLNTEGIGLNFSSEDDLSVLLSEIVLRKNDVRMTSPLISLTANHKYTPNGGGNVRIAFQFADTSGAMVPANTFEMRDNQFSGGPSFWASGRNLAIQFAGQTGGTDHFEFKHNDGALASISCGQVNGTVVSARDSKVNIREPDFDPLLMVTAARALTFEYRDNVTPRPAKPGTKVLKRKKNAPMNSDRSEDMEWVDAEWSTPPPDPNAVVITQHLGPMADDIQAIAPDMVKLTKQGEKTLALNDMIGVAWAAAGKLVDATTAISARLDAVVARLDAIDKLPKAPK